MADLTIRCCPVCPEKRIVASRVAARLQKEDSITVNRVNGGLGELTVLFEGRTIYQSNRLWYDRTSKVLERVRAALNTQQTASDL
jgi:hypothetical protein